MLPGSILTPAGLFWFGWSAQAGLHWIMPISEHIHLLDLPILKRLSSWRIHILFRDDLKSYPHPVILP